MRDDKIYWSGDFKGAWGSDDWKKVGILNFFYIPSRWWSISEWKFALSLRSSVNKELLKLLGKAK